MVKGSQYVELANDLEINKAITLLKTEGLQTGRWVPGDTLKLCSI